MFVLLIPVIVLIYFYFTRNHDYWKKRNVKHDRPLPLFGNLYMNVMGKRSIVEVATDMYNKYPNEKVVGMYHGTIPELVIRDLDIAKNILNTDFGYFYPRGLGRDSQKEPVFRNLFQAEGDTWKLLRQQLTPAFTVAKLKKMFPLVVECAEKLQKVGKDIVNKGGECDVRELMARFTTEFIGACGFGLQVDSINNESSLFRSFGRKIFTRNRSIKNVAIVMLYGILPDFRPFLQTVFNDSSIIDTTVEIFEGVRAQRNCKPSGRHDFIDLLLELEQKGKITGESIEKKSPDGTPVPVEMEMDIMLMAAQVFAFFAAGFETSSSATSYLLHELAFHPEEQIKIQEDIDRVIAKYDNQLCFDSVADMTLLSMGFKEAMRKFPSLGNLHRVCAKRYTIPELGITLDPGVRIIIPVQAIQNDEKYFEYPSAFKPERFTESQSESRHKFSYLPFGGGPRMCIGTNLFGGRRTSYETTQVLTRHGAFASYLYRFKCKATASCICSPTEDETVSHLLFECPANGYERYCLEEQLGVKIGKNNIGARLGEMQSLAGLASFLHHFSVEPGVSTKRELEVNHGSNLVQSIQGGLPLRLKLRNKDRKSVA